MPIRPGEPWGRVGPRPVDAVHVGADRELGRLVGAHRTAGEAIPPVLLTGGDLWRSLGGGAPRPGDDVAIVPVDVMRVEAGGCIEWAVAHVVGHRPWRRGGWFAGEVWAVMNAQFVGRLDVAPRSHPGDGKVDVLTVDSSMSVRHRWQARRRLPLGTHVPHPAIRVQRVARITIDTVEAVQWRLDSEVWLTASRVEIEVLPDALEVCV